LVTFLGKVTEKWFLEILKQVQDDEWRRPRFRIKSGMTRIGDILPPPLTPPPAGGDF